MITKECPSFQINIWVAGNYEDAQRALRRYLRGNPLCVTVRPCEYIYTGGQEAGVVVTLINYPRFPRAEKELIDIATVLTTYLMTELCQQSASLETPHTTIWFCNRQNEESPSKNA